MPPKFNLSNFKFTEEDPVLEHIEGDPTPEERDPRKIWLQEHDTIWGVTNTLAIDLDTLELAALLKTARFRQRTEEASPIRGGVFIELPD